MCGCGKFWCWCTSNQHAKEHGFESFIATIINNYFPSATQENNYFMILFFNADIWKAIPRQDWETVSYSQIDKYTQFSRLSQSSSVLISFEAQHLQLIDVFYLISLSSKLERFSLKRKLNERWVTLMNAQSRSVKQSPKQYLLEY